MYLHQVVNSRARDVELHHFAQLGTVQAQVLVEQQLDARARLQRRVLQLVLAADVRPRC